MQPTYEYSATVVAQKVLKLPAKIGNERADFFQDNLEHLQALENEARLRLLIAFLQKGNLSFSKEKTREDERPDFSFLALPSDQITLSSLKELLQELEIGNRIMAQNSMKQGTILNFEKFCESYQLDRFERLVVMLLFANSTCMEFRKIFNEYHRKGQKSSNGEMTIGELLSIISSDYREQLQHRKYFSINEKLIGQEILPHYSFSNIMSVLDLEMYLHERIVRFILGDNNVYNVSLQCVTREKPTIALERVVLPEKLKHDVVALASNYSQQLAKREALHLKEFYGYGTGLVFLFYGPSGTGKTMLAYALAHSLGKELLQLNTRDAARNEFTFAEVIRYIFREARLTDAIAFFDECDDLILKNPSECKQFLIEIEKAECITILATN